MLEGAYIDKHILPHLLTIAEGGWWLKVHGSAFQRSGIPDLIGSSKKLRGRLVGIEVKRPDTDYDVTPLQEYNIEEIKVAGGVAFVARFKPDIEKGLQKFL